ncbi:MAG: STAS domain-containing protein [Acidobacteriota bacterium]|nr:STAS domain-containing protein [Acidobacteriota bacterium]
MKVIHERHDDRTRIARLEGRIDSTNCTEFEAQLEAGADVDATLVLLDFGEVSFISSAGLRVVLKLAKQLRSRNAKLGLCSLPTPIQQVLEVSGFDRILPIYASRAEAVGTRAVENPLERLRLPREFSLADVADNVKDIALLTIEQHEFVNDRTLPEATRRKALTRIETVLTDHLEELKRRRLKILKDMFALASRTLEEAL